MPLRPPLVPLLKGDKDTKPCWPLVRTRADLTLLIAFVLSGRIKPWVPVMKLALVKGGAKGIGRAIASRLLDDGMNVAVVDCAEPSALDSRVRFFKGDGPPQPV